MGHLSPANVVSRLPLIVFNVTLAPPACRNGSGVNTSSCQEDKLLQLSEAKFCTSGRSPSTLSMAFPNLIHFYARLSMPESLNTQFFSYHGTFFFDAPLVLSVQVALTG